MPFLVLMAAYGGLQVSRMHRGDPNGPYRLAANMTFIAYNLGNFPLWIIHVFSHPHGPSGGWFHECNDSLNNGIGWALLSLLLVAGAVLWWRSAAYRKSALLCLVWIAVFSAIPVYCGGYGHHINLPMVGYAMLLGGTLAQFASLPRWPALQSSLRVLLVLTTIGLAALGTANADAYLTRSMHAPDMIRNGHARSAPPLPASALGISPLIYVEDRQGLGAWCYGVGHLFQYAYQDTRIEECVVPAMKDVPGELRAKWANHPNAFFFSYTDDGRWIDNSKQFAALVRPAALRPGQRPGNVSSGAANDKP